MQILDTLYKSITKKLKFLDILDLFPWIQSLWASPGTVQNCVASI